MPTVSQNIDPGLDLSLFQGDPDWSRFAFTPGSSALFEHHRALRQRWQDIGIQIDSLQHLQYLERYRVSRDGQVATVQYHHDKHFRMTRTSFVQADSAFTREALAAMTAPIPVAPDGGAVEVGPSEPGNQDSTSEDFITRFLEEIDQALEASSIRRVDARPMSYRLRVKFTDDNRTGELDFIHDRTGRWTSSSEVGGAGKSRGLLEEVKDHLKRGLGG